MHENPARRHPVLGLVIVILLGGGIATLAVACASPGRGRPSVLLEEARAAFEQRNFETAYLRSKKIGLDYPESTEADEAFSMAAQSLKFLYYRDRYDLPGAPWVTSEPVFMFGWLARYFEEGDPTDAANAFFIGFPFNVFQEFQQFEKKRPGLSGWVVRAKDDNGMIESVTAKRTEAPAS